LGLIAKPAVAQPGTVITTEQSASILVFPKVIADGTRDTIIQITNTSNNMQQAHCFYIDGAPTNPLLPPGSLNPPLCQETDFDIWLTLQQPTHWVVSTGRWSNPAVESCSGAPSPVTCCPLDLPVCSGTTEHSGGKVNPACCDAGLNLSAIPPVAPDFTGELICIEVDASGAPISGNSIKGEATLEDIATGDVSKYNAIGIQGNDNNNGDDVLCLGSPTAPADPTLCPTGNEYAGCPASWVLDHAATGAPDAVIEDQAFCTTHPCSWIGTNLTVVPCTEDFETQALTTITLQFLVTNEYEQTLSASTTFACWASFDLGAPNTAVLPLLPGISDIFNAGTLGGELAQTQMRSAAGTPGGTLAVIEERHQDTVNHLFARSDQNGHMIGELNVMDLITIPTGQGNDATP
jgi:hypothetical protein